MKIACKVKASIPGNLC